MNELEEMREKIKKLEKEKALEIAEELKKKDYFTAKDVDELADGEISFSTFKRYVPIEKTHRTERREISIEELCNIATIACPGEWYYDDCQIYDYIDGKIYETIIYENELTTYYEIRGEKNEEV